MVTKKPGFASIDEYIATFPDDVQKVLHEVRTTIKAAAPKAEEKISYGMPTFTVDNQKLIYFAGWKKHVSLYPIPAGSEAFNQEVAKYTDGKGTVKFPLDRPLPLKLIAQMVKIQLENNLDKTGNRSKGDKK